MGVQDGIAEDSDLGRARHLDPGAEILNPVEHRVIDVTGPEPTELEPEVIIKFGGGCLVRCVADPNWWMGEANATDGSIRCWGQYGQDLAEAFEGL
jgi:hypothetical protein